METIAIGLLLILSFIIVKAFGEKQVSLTFRDKRNEVVVSVSSRVPARKVKGTEEIVVDIQNRIIAIYNDSMSPNRREEIVAMLRYLYNWCDTDDFLENNTEIKSYIFGKIA